MTEQKNMALETRAGRAGYQTGDGIIELGELIHPQAAQKNFYNGLFESLKYKFHEYGLIPKELIE